VRWPGGRAASCTSNPLRRFGQLDHLQGLPLRKAENEYRLGSASGMRVGIKAVVDDSKLCESRHQLNPIDATPIVALPNFCFWIVVSASSHPGSKPAPCAVRDYSIPRTTRARRFQPPTLHAEERRWCVRQASFRTRSPGRSAIARSRRRFPSCHAALFASAVERHRKPHMAALSPEDIHER
jgi:hypothetical protein